jgi:uncharacterized membrane protein HdeD (DUF308 family)
MPGSNFLIIRGIVGVVFGFLSFLWPGVTIAILVTIFAWYAMIDGITNLVLGLKRSDGNAHQWSTILGGLTGIAVGVLAFVWPGITALALVWFIAAWALVTGVFAIVTAIRLRRELKGEWILMLIGVMSMAFGVLIFAFPAAGAVGIAWVLGAYAAATGILLIALGIRLRSPVLLGA